MIITINVVSIFLKLWRMKEMINENFVQSPISAEIAPLKCSVWKLPNGLCAYVGWMEAKDFVVKFEIWKEDSWESKRDTFIIEYGLKREVYQSICGRRKYLTIGDKCGGFPCCAKKTVKHWLEIWKKFKNIIAVHPLWVQRSSFRFYWWSFAWLVTLGGLTFNTFDLSRESLFFPNWCILYSLFAWLFFCFKCVRLLLVDTWYYDGLGC